MPDFMFEIFGIFLYLIISYIAMRLVEKHTFKDSLLRTRSQLEYLADAGLFWPITLVIVCACYVINAAKKRYGEEI